MATVINDDACIRSLGSGSAIGTGDGTRRIVRYTADATLKLADAGCIIEIDSPTPVNITVPSFASVPYKSAVYFDFVQIGIGSVTVVAAAGVTLETNGLVMSAKDSTAFLYRRDTVNDFVFSNAPPADWVTLSNRPANLVALGGLTGAINTFPAFSGVGAMIVKAISDFGYSLVAAANAAAVKVLLGLDLVSNTSDANKPVSTATQAALDGKLSDVLNGATAAGAVALVSTPVTTPAGINRTVSRLVSTNTDLTITAPATAGDPVQIGLNGVPLKYWEEASSAHPSAPTTTELLTWRAKTVAPYTLANTVMNIPIKQGITLRDPLESGSTFPTAFTSGLDLQVKGANGTSATYAKGGYCFGEGNTAVVGSICAGINNASQGGGVAVGISNSLSGGGNLGVSLGISNYSDAGAGGVAVGRSNSANGGGIAFGVSNNAYGNYTTNYLSGYSNSNTGVSSSANTLLGFNNSSASQSRAILLGVEITATAASSIVIASTIGTTKPSDQGINGFQQFGRKAAIPLQAIVSGITDWTNAAWRDVALSTMAAIDAGSLVNKFSANFMCTLSPDTGAGTPVVPTRTGIILIECWVTGGVLTPTVKVLQGGDANFLTYFDFQFVTVTTGVKLQWKFASDPSGTSPNTGKVNFWGNLEDTSSYA